MTHSHDTHSGQRIGTGIIFLAASRLAKSILVIMSLVLIARRFGANIETDIFFMAQLWPFLIANLGRAIMSITLIPVFADIFHNEKEEDAWRFASNTLNIFFVSTIVIAVLYLGLSIAVLKIMVFFDVPKIGEVSFDFIVLTLLFLPVIVLNPMFAFWESILFSKKDYIVCGIATLLIGICEVGSILLFSDRYGIKVIAIGISLGFLFQLLFVLPKFRTKSKYFGTSICLKYPGSRKIFSLLLPALFGACLTQIAAVSDWILASILGEARVTSFVYASRLAYFIPNFFAMSVILPLLGKFAGYIVKRDYDNLKVTMLRTIRFVLLTILPFCVWFAIMSEPLSEFLFLRGKFSVEAIVMVRSVLLFLTPMIFFQCINSIFRQVLFAMRRIRFLVIEGTAIVLFNILLSVILIQYMDVGGLALGTSIAAMCDCSILIFYFQREVKPFPKSGTMLFLSKIVFASLIMGVAISFLSRHFDGLFPVKENLNQFFSLVLSAFAGATVYLGLAALFGALRLKDPLGWETD